MWAGKTDKDLDMKGVRIHVNGLYKPEKLGGPRDQLVKRQVEKVMQ